MAARVHFETVATGGGGGSGTVTNVSALTIGTAGTNLSSTVINSTTTPVITLNVPTASAVNRGALSSADWSTFNGKQALLVSGTNIKTVNGNSLLGSGNLVISGGGTPSGVAGSVQFSDGTNFASDAANFFYDDTNNRLGIGTNTPTKELTIDANSTDGGLIIRSQNDSILFQVTKDGTSANTCELFQYSGGAVNFAIRSASNASYFNNGTFTFGATTNLGAKLNIKGSGTTSATTALLVQDSAGTESFKILDNGTAFIRTSLQLSSGVTFSTNTNTLAIGTTLTNITGNVGTLPVYTFSMVGDISTSNTSNYFSIQKTISPSAGSANFRNLIVDYTINASGVQTGTATGIFLNATETALNGIVHNLMDLQVGGVSKLTVTNAGATIIGGTVTSDGGFRSIAYFDSFQRVALNNGLNTNPQNYLISGGAGRILLVDNSEGDFNRLQFGGTTSSFPSLKRNGTAIDVRLADDSNYALLNTGATFIKGSGTTSGTTALLVQNSAGTQSFKVADSGSVQIGLTSGINWTFNSNILSSSQYAYIAGSNGSVLTNGSFSGGVHGNGNGGKVSDSDISTPQVASAVLEVSSTTKGFLPPRMTAAQINAIALPATGLMAFNLDIGQVCVYDGAIWHKLNQSPM